MSVRSSHQSTSMIAGQCWGVAGRLDDKHVFEEGHLRLGEKCFLGQSLTRDSRDRCLKVGWLFCEPVRSLQVGFISTNAITLVPKKGRSSRRVQNARQGWPWLAVQPVPPTVVVRVCTKQDLRLPQFPTGYSAFILLRVAAAWVAIWPSAR